MKPPKHRSANAKALATPRFAQRIKPGRKPNVIDTLDDWNREAEECDRIERESAAQNATRNAEWCKRWPRHCKDCGGWGTFETRQGHPYGSTTAYETLTETCDAPDTADICHRCGYGGLDPQTSEGPCRVCGWDYDDGLHGQ